MGAGQPAHPIAESRRQPLPGDPVVVLRCDVAELRAVAEVVQRGREHQLVVGAIVARPGRGLQRVVQFVDGVLVPDAAHRPQQLTDFVENSHAASVPEIGLYQFLTCCSARQHLAVSALSR
jgi:NAD(P)-dependent dehydrogenase (short-subunit alcohol dehydrogenase family)